MLPKPPNVQENIYFLKSNDPCLVHDYMTDLERSQDLFWQMRFERRAGGEGVQRSIDNPYIVWLRFSASFLKVFKKSLATTVI